SDNSFVLWRRDRRAARSLVKDELQEHETMAEPGASSGASGASNDAAEDALESAERPRDSQVLLSIGTGLAEAAPLQPLRQRIEALCHDIRINLGVEVPLPEVYL
ncbi:type III secretion component, partial [Pseudomonas savastanoi pv. glycinea str. race 4]